MNTLELEQYLDLFYRISGMEIAFIDRYFHQVLLRQADCEQLCHLIHRYPKCTKLCRDSDWEYLSKTKEKGNLIKYTCPFGFFTAIAPIRRDKEIVGYLMYGPGIEEKENCNDTPEKVAEALIPGFVKEQLRASILNIPHYPKDKLDTYSDLLMVMANYIGQQDLALDEHPRIAALTKQYIDSNLGSKITLTNLSWKLHCSTVTLTEHFRKEYGISIMTYVTQQRMKLAAQLLSDHTKYINEVASLCGFADTEYFSRTFKRHYGASPSQWRKQNGYYGEHERFSE